MKIRCTQQIIRLRSWCFICLLPLIGLMMQRCSSSPSRADTTTISIYLGQPQSALDYHFHSSHIQTPFLEQLAANGVLFTNGYLPDENKKAAFRGLINKAFPNQLLLSDNDVLTVQSSLISALTDQGYKTILIGGSDLVNPSTFGVDHVIPVKTPANMATIPIEIKKIIATGQPCFFIVDIPEAAMKIDAMAYADQDTTAAYISYLQQITAQDQTLAVIDKSIQEANPKGKNLRIFCQQRGIGNGKNLTVRTPIILSAFPRTITNKTSTALVSTQDIMPTIFDALNLYIDSLPGRSLMPIMQGKREDIRPMLMGNLRDGIYIRKAGFFYTQDFEDKNRTIFELSYDPYCRDNMTEYHPRKIGNFRKDIKGYLEGN